MFKNLSIFIVPQELKDIWKANLYERPQSIQVVLAARHHACHNITTPVTPIAD